MKKQSKQITIFSDISELYTLDRAAQKRGIRPEFSDLGRVKKAVLVVEGGQVIWSGPHNQFKRKKRTIVGSSSLKEVSLSGGMVLPGLIDCHTHLLFSGERQDEFEKRNLGATYQQIAAEGGGIRKTMGATRSSSRQKLLELGQERIDRFIEQGVTTVEVKSGYGLDKKSEIRLLEVANQLKRARIVPTFLGPHSLPPEFKSASQYLEYLIQEVLPVVVRRKLARRADIFVEQGFFDLELGLQWLKACRAHGLDLSVHADQMSSLGTSLTMARLGAKSVDHAIHLRDEEIGSLAKTDVTAVLLPTSDFYLKIPYPKARTMISQGVRVALSSDFNPGTAPSQDISFVGVLARLEMKMSLSEVITAWTVNAAHVLGLEQKLGALTVGRAADFTVFSADIDQLFYRVGHHPVQSTWIQGQKIY